VPAITVGAGMKIAQWYFRASGRGPDCRSCVRTHLGRQVSAAGLLL